MPKPSLMDLHLAHAGKVSSKWEAYFGVYERNFAAIRETPVALLEIGVQNGGSIELWARYFESATVLVGCDIDQRCAALQFDDPRIDIVAADVNSDFAYNDIVSLAPALDVIIDDGSHRSADVIATLLRYFPLLKPGGVFVVEDLHAAYWPQLGGGLSAQRSSMAFLKGLADLANYEFWSKDSSPTALLQAFFGGGAAPAFLSDGSVESIEFSNSMAVLRRAARPHNLGRLVVAGNEAPIAPDLLELRARQAAGDVLSPC